MAWIVRLVKTGTGGEEPATDVLKIDRRPRKQEMTLCGARGCFNPQPRGNPAPDRARAS
jgi:hypothetical protein